MTITITGSSKECVAEAEVRESFLFTFSGLLDLHLHFSPSFTLCVYGIVLYSSLSLGLLTCTFISHLPSPVVFMVLCCIVLSFKC